MFLSSRTRNCVALTITTERTPSTPRLDTNFLAAPAGLCGYVIWLRALIVVFPVISVVSVVSVVNVIWLKLVQRVVKRAPDLPHLLERAAAARPVGQQHVVAVARRIDPQRRARVSDVSDRAGGHRRSAR